MARIGISQVSENPPQFVARNRDGEQIASAAEIPSPYEWPVENGGDDKLMAQLRWLLETFLQYPFDPYTTRADHIEAALKKWGTKAFEALFDNRVAGAWLPQNADSVFDILITCDDPALLAWPWEALHDPALGFLGHRARIQRRLSRQIPNPPEIPELPKDRVRILLVTARPYEDDVEYRSVSRPLVELIRREKLPASVQVLRPPTFDALRAHLEAHPAEYHIVHFDGHGGYGTGAPQPDRDHFHGHEGRLLFEKEDGSPDEVTATRLTTMLRGCRVPFIVLNACRSAQLDAQAAEGRAFASVAGALVQAGFRGVLAMAYNLTVTGAQQFLPPFYRKLFAHGNLLEAAREGRLQMLNHATRSSWNPEAKLPDWLLPVVYQQREDFDLQFARNAAAPDAPDVSLPNDALREDPLGFFGRDAAIHALERFLGKPAAAILIHGLGGVGKTTLAAHFLQWLRDTGGLDASPFWFSFDDIRSAAFVFNQIGRAIFGGGFDSGQPAHMAQLAKTLKEDLRLVLVWDNFESARGFEADRTGALLTEADAFQLRDFLAALRGGKTKVIITSRSDEAWLPEMHCRRLPLRGLRGEELLEFASRVLSEFEIQADRKDPELQELLAELGGHPVLIRAVLPELRQNPAADLRKRWKANLQKILSLGSDPNHARLLATLNLALGTLSECEAGCLIAIGLHERYVDLDLLNAMGQSGPPDYESNGMGTFVQRLEHRGLLTGVGSNIFAIHPLLTSYLRSAGNTGSAPEIVEAWEKAFVEVIAALADHFASKELHEQRGVFSIHRSNFYRTLDLAEAHEAAGHIGALTQSLGAYAQNSRNWIEATRLFERFAENRRLTHDPLGEAGAYHQLARIAQEQREFAASESWYLKSLAISEKQGNEHYAASTYHQLGRIAEEQWNFVAAEGWYLKSLAIEEKEGNERGQAITYHQLGFIAQEQREFAEAESWYFKSLVISERLGYEHGAAGTYHQLGIIAQQQREFAAAESWYFKSLAITEKQGNKHYAATTYGQLGNIAVEQQEFAAAESWYLKSLAISERQGNDRLAASTYHQLGRIAEQQRELAAAESWYLKSLV